MRKKSIAADRAGQKGVRSHVERDRSRPRGQAGTQRVTNVADRPVRLADVGPRIPHEDVIPCHAEVDYAPSGAGPFPSAPAAKSTAIPSVQSRPVRLAASRRSKSASRPQAKSLHRGNYRSSIGRRRIAAGDGTDRHWREEAASASQETLAVATNTARTLAQARDRADSSRRRTDALQGHARGVHQSDRSVGEQHQTQRRTPSRLGLRHRATDPKGR